MPDKKISALPAFSGDVAPADLIPIVDTSASVTKKLAFSDAVFPYIILRSTGAAAERWKVTIDDTGMLTTENLGV